MRVQCCFLCGLPATTLQKHLHFDQCVHWHTHAHLCIMFLCEISKQHVSQSKQRGLFYSEIQLRLILWEENCIIASWLFEKVLNYVRCHSVNP